MLMVHETDFVLWVVQRDAYKAERREGGRNHFCNPNCDTAVLRHPPQTAGVWKYWDEVPFLQAPKDQRFFLPEHNADSILNFTDITHFD